MSRAWLLAAVILVAVPARADDTIVAPGTAGLVFRRAQGIAMQREDLALSPGQVRVRYEMRNDRGAPTIAHVAFPLPTIFLSAQLYSPSPVPDAAPLEFLSFQLVVDGQRVEPGLRAWATLRDHDVTAALRSAGLDIARLPMFPAAASRALPAVSRARLVRAHLIDTEGNPQWAIHVAFEWDQAFRPGLTIIEHSYRPLLGGTYETDPARPALLRFDDTDYCLTPAQWSNATGQLRARLAQDHDAMLWFSTLSFVLKTARNWTGPIGDFHLTIDAKAPEDIVAACLPGMRVERAGTAHLEATAHAWVADRDLNALFVSVRRPE